MPTAFRSIEIKSEGWTLLQAVNVPSLAFIVSTTWTSTHTKMFDIYVIDEAGSEHHHMYHVLDASTSLSGSLGSSLKEVCKQYFITRVFVEDANAWKARFGVYGPYTAVLHAGSAPSQYQLEVLDFDELKRYLDMFVPSGLEEPWQVHKEDTLV